MLTKWINWLFPPRCIQCNNTLIISEPEMCSTCLDELPGWPTEFNPSQLADDLFGGRVPIQAVHLLATFHSESPLRKALHSIKYNRNKELAKQLGSLLFHRHAHAIRADIVVPVPIHPDKKRRRGYNQAEEIARGVSQSSGLEVRNALMKVENTSSQTLLNREQRWENVANSFQLSEPSVANLNVLLVDDTLTTGATLEACAIQLLNGGAKSISIAALGYASV